MFALLMGCRASDEQAIITFTPEAAFLGISVWLSYLGDGEGVRKRADASPHA